MKINLSFVFGCCFVFFVSNLNAQNSLRKEDPAITQMMQQFRDRNRWKPEIDGYRIQILATTDRPKVESETLRFQSLFPSIKADWVHNKPYYRLRAGACLTRLETHKLLNTIRKEYPGAYLVMEKLKPEEVIY